MIGVAAGQHPDRQGRRAAAAGAAGGAIPISVYFMGVGLPSAGPFSAVATLAVAVAPVAPRRRLLRMSTPPNLFPSLWVKCVQAPRSARAQHRAPRPPLLMVRRTGRVGRAVARVRLASRRDAEHAAHPAGLGKVL